MPRILGIDPGSRITGYGLVEETDGRCRYIASGTIKTEGRPFPERLKLIFEHVTTVIEQYQPQILSIESVFVHRNPGSALKLGQARGAAICAAVVRELPVAEYSPSEIKQAIVGSGGAGKEQVQYMVRMLLGLQGALQLDASDALAAALCHGHRSALALRLGTHKGVSG